MSSTSWIIIANYPGFPQKCFSTILSLSALSYVSLLCFFQTFIRSVRAVVISSLHPLYSCVDTEICTLNANKMKGNVAMYSFKLQMASVNRCVFGSSSCVFRHFCRGTPLGRSLVMLTMQARKLYCKKRVSATATVLSTFGYNICSQQCRLGAWLRLGIALHSLQ